MDEQTKQWFDSLDDREQAQHVRELYAVDRAVAPAPF